MQAAEAISEGVVRNAQRLQGVARLNGELVGQKRHPLQRFQLLEVLKSPLPRRPFTRKKKRRKEEAFVAAFVFHTGERRRAVASICV